MNVLRSIVLVTFGVSARSLKNIPSRCLVSEFFNVGSLSRYLREKVLLRFSIVSNRNNAAPVMCNMIHIHISGDMCLRRFVCRYGHIEIYIVLVAACVPLSM